MSVTVYAKNLMLDHLASGVPMYVAAHDAGGVEVQMSGRKELTFSAGAVDGSVIGVVTENLTIPAGKTVQEVRVWDNTSGGNLIMSYTLPVPEVYSNEGALVVNSITLSLN